MMSEKSDKPQLGQQQSDANKPDEARAKEEPKAANMLGGVQPSTD